MKYVPTIVFILLLIFGCAQKFDDKVVVIEKTRSYHRPGCGQVMMARVSMVTRDDAKKMNYQPCGYCKPDQRQ